MPVRGMAGVRISCVKSQAPVERGRIMPMSDRAGQARRAAVIRRVTAANDMQQPEMMGVSRQYHHPPEGLSMKKIDVDKDYKRTKFLIVAMIVQIIVVFVCLVIYYSWLRS